MYHDPNGQNKPSSEFVVVLCYSPFRFGESESSRLIALNCTKTPGHLVFPHGVHQPGTDPRKTAAMLLHQQVGMNCNLDCMDIIWVTDMLKEEYGIIHILGAKLPQRNRFKDKGPCRCESVGKLLEGRVKLPTWQQALFSALRE